MIGAFFVQPQEDSMIIVLIHWKIILGMEDDFFKHWKEKAKVKDRSGLIAEYLSRAGRGEETSKLPWPVNWHFESQDGEGGFTSYINVGLWESEKDFHAQVGEGIDDSKEDLPFEADKRRRTIVYPQHWRVGDAKHPENDSDGVQ